MSSISDYFILLGRGIIPLLVIMSAVGFILTLERWIFFRRCNNNIQIFMEGIKNLFFEGKLQEAINLCEQEGSPSANIIRCALSNIELPPSELKANIKSNALLEIPRCERHISALLNIAKIAPFLGLIGIVISFYSAFHHLQTSGINYVSASIFSKEVTFSALLLVSSMIVSLFANIAYNVLYNKLNDVVFKMEWTYNEVLQFIFKRK